MIESLPLLIILYFFVYLSVKFIQISLKVYFSYHIFELISQYFVQKIDSLSSRIIFIVFGLINS